MKLQKQRCETGGCAWQLICEATGITGVSASYFTWWTAVQFCDFSVAILMGTLRPRDGVICAKLHSHAYLALPICYENRKKVEVCCRHEVQIALKYASEHIQYTPCQEV